MKKTPAVLFLSLFGLARMVVAAPAGTAELKWYKDCWAKFNSHQWDAFAKCYTDAAVSTQSGSPKDITGREAIVANAKEYAAAFPDGKGEIQIALAREGGKELVSVAIFRGTNNGPMKGPMGEMPATKKKVGYQMLHRLTTDDKMASREWFIYDLPTMLTQLGIARGPVRPVMTKGLPEKVTLVAKGDEAEAKNTEAHRKVYELFDKKDPAMEDYFADDIVESNNSEPKDTVGKKALMEYNKGFWSGFPDAKVIVEDAWGAGPYSVAVARVTGTNDGDWPAMGLKKTGKKINVPFVEIVKWEKGKAKWSGSFMNGMDFATQLGLAPPTGAPPKK
jgi:predicted ester cyclase